MSYWKIFNYLKEIRYSTSIKQKLLFTLAGLAIYRFLVTVPVPFADIEKLFWSINLQWTWGLEYFAMLLGWTLEKFSIIAVWLIPFINASIIMQLLTAVVPKLEELQEQGEIWYMQIQRYTRWLTLPLAFLQSIWMVFFINAVLGNVIDTSKVSIVLLSAFVMTVWTIMLMWLWELITEKWISNGISLIIFSSIVAWMTSKIYSYISAAGSNIVGVLIFMILIVIGLIVLSILLIRTRKEIPIIYTRQWKVEETAVLPIPLNPVGMIPIIFAIAFISFPYLVAQILKRTALYDTNAVIQSVVNFIEKYLNIYDPMPSIVAIVLYFVLIVLFTYFYTFIVFNPEKIAENIQKRWGFIPWIRPWEETAKYLNDILMKLCFLGWIGLWIIWIYTYVIGYIPLISNYIAQIWTVPVVVSWAGIIIIVGVVQEIINKLNAELAMERYDRI